MRESRWGQENLVLMFPLPSNHWILDPSYGAAVSLATYVHKRFERLVQISAMSGPLPGACSDFDLTESYRLIRWTSTVEPGEGITFKLTGDRGAVLITKHSTLLEDALRETTFAYYAQKHSQSWVDFSRDRGHGRDIHPILVTGVDLTREFATAAYSDNHAGMECEFSAAVTTVASASTSVWGSWRAGESVHTNCGPRPARSIQGNHGSSKGSVLEPALPDEYNQCVFIRYLMIPEILVTPEVSTGGRRRTPKPDPIRCQPPSPNVMVF
jgi:hypothetical protein